MLRLGLGCTNPVGTRGVGHVSVFGLQWCGMGGERVVAKNMVWIICVDYRFMYLYIVLCGYLCIFGAPNDEFDICFLPCICLWLISPIQTCLCVVVGPGFVCTSSSCKEQCRPSSGSAWPPCSKKTVNRDPITGGGWFRHNLHSSLQPP